jgi:hypothetical protein
MIHARTLNTLLVTLLIATATSCQRSHPSTSPTTQRVQLGDKTFVLELALDAATRYQGLSDRSAIADNGGMLFVFPDAQPRQFVMRRCLVPIDIVFLDAGGRVVATQAMQVEPYDTREGDLRRYSSQWPSQFAIEFAGGTLAKLAISPGQRIILPLDDLKRHAR